MRLPALIPEAAGDASNEHVLYMSTGPNEFQGSAGLIRPMVHRSTATLWSVTKHNGASLSVLPCDSIQSRGEPRGWQRTVHNDLWESTCGFINDGEIATQTARRQGFGDRGHGPPTIRGKHYGLRDSCEKKSVCTHAGAADGTSALRPLFIPEARARVSRVDCLTAATDTYCDRPTTDKRRQRTQALAPNGIIPDRLMTHERSDKASVAA
jgi:hypothetical protein